MGQSAVGEGSVDDADHPGTYVPTVNRVAFVLELIEDFYQSDTNQAIMDAFKNANASLTVAVIGSRIGQDSALTSKILQGLSSSTWELELAW